MLSASIDTTAHPSPRQLKARMSTNESRLEQLRSVRSVLLHLFALQIGVSIAAGHVGSLRKVIVPMHVLFVLSSILFPATAFIETIGIVVVTLRNYKSLSTNGVVYLLACAAGAVIKVPYSEGEIVIPLRVLRSSIIEPVPLPPNKSVPWKLVGRVVVLLVGLTVVLGTLFLVIRRSLIVGILYSQA